ncbi:Caleosin related protein-domain-containing protein [Gaertneriomyces semiglobifer]|nr:Caleosin related protein-domain-containing protein [Gaertneriomyces semiglobifer]
MTTLAVDNSARIAQATDSSLKPQESDLISARRDSGHASHRDANITRKPIVTAVSGCLATSQYPIPSNLDEFVQNPGCPRANEAADGDHPHGSEDNKKKLTVMQQHVEFFDRNKDGVIWPYETFLGFRAVGFNIFFCLLAMMIIHFGFSYPSLDSWLPDPFFRIYIKNIHRCKHGSDSGTYDTEGRYTPQKFEELFSKYDKDNKGGLNLREMWEMTLQIRNTFDFFG